MSSRGPIPTKKKIKKKDRDRKETTAPKGEKRNEKDKRKEEGKNTKNSRMVMKVEMRRACDTMDKDSSDVIIPAVSFVESELSGAVRQTTAAVVPKIRTSACVRMG